MTVPGVSAAGDVLQARTDGEVGFFEKELRGTVEALFRTGFSIRTGKGLFWITRERERLHTRAGFLSRMNFPDPAVGCAVLFRPGEISFGARRFPLLRTVVPPRRLKRIDPAFLERNLRFLRRIVTLALGQREKEKVQRYEASVEERGRSGLLSFEDFLSLFGTGPGSTPLADDFFTGLLLGDRWFCSQRGGEVIITPFFLERLRERTNHVAWAQIEMARRGQSVILIERLLAAMGRKNVSGSLVWRCARLGASSGAAILSGLCVAVCRSMRRRKAA
ncbi:MAG: DUF2877 domain-containing protein [Candidatus Hydrogenedentota bacterium]|nr:MAG: DUF2877 domain-containing protein [Candidatus Hydrogenedentota bacterium]